MSHSRRRSPPSVVERLSPDRGAPRTAELRAMLVGLLRAVGEPMDAKDLRRCAEAAGWDLGARPGKCIANAMRFAVRSGRVERVSRAIYRATGG